MHPHPEPADVSPPSGGALPAEIWLFLLVAPVLYLPVIHQRIFEASAWDITRWLAENGLPFLVIPLAIEAVYRWVLPRWVGPVKGLTRRVALHVAVATLVAAPVGLLIQQLIIRLREEGPPAVNFTLACVVITWTVVVPALLVQEYRVRAKADAHRLAASTQSALRAELEALQSRTNPHFLFNALNTVASLIPTHPALAEQTVERLSDFLRYSLRSSRQEWVPLTEEVDRVRDYLEVQRARFGARLEYTMEVEPAVESFQVPPLVLLPLVENAVLHGIAPRVGGGSLHVRVQSEGSGVQVTVVDSGGARGEPVHRGNGIALQDLRRRLTLVYGTQSALRLEPNNVGGMTAALSLPGALK